MKMMGDFRGLYAKLFFLNLFSQRLLMCKLYHITCNDMQYGLEGAC